jgi:hypothetical protein
MAEQVPPVERFTGEIGVVSRKQRTTYVSQTSDAEKFTLKVANEMKQDPTIRGIWRLMNLMLLAHFGRFVHDNPTIEEFVNDSLEEMPGWDYAKTTLLSGAIYGFSVLEKVWQNNDGDTWTYAKLAPRHPATLAGGFVVDEKGNIASVGQKPPGKRHADRIPIPYAKVAHWAYDAEFGPGETPEGESLLVGAERSWTSVKAIIRLWNLALERGPLPLLKWPTASGEIYCPICEIEEERVLVYAHIIQNLEASGAIIWEGGEGIGEPDILSNDTVEPEDFENAAEYHDSKMAASMLAPKLLFEEPEHASRAQAGTNLEILLLNLAGMQNGYSRVLREQVCKDLIVVNFAGVTDYGQWQADELNKADMQMLAEVLERVKRSGVESTDADVKKQRGKFEPLYAQPGDEGYIEPGSEEDEEPEPEPVQVAPPPYEE